MTRSGRQDPDAPYLSVIAASRNDEHGGNLLGRTQIFVEAWINQAKRYNISSELILVEWNPPAGRERLAKALRWPSDSSPCKVRIIEVPPEIHSRYKHGENLPLYQMIGKNAGIRRSRGQFLLLTNIDIVFSSELCEFLAARRLEEGRMYRIDRTDVGEDVPVDGTLDQQLAYCRSHVLRLYSREEAYPITPEGFRQMEREDIARGDSGIHLGGGWFPVERSQPAKPFRWIGDEAEIVAEVPAGGALLELEVEPGPGVGLEAGPKLLEVIDWKGSKAADWSISGRATLHLIIPPLPNGPAQSIRLRVPHGGTPLLHDHRILNFRVFRCELADFARTSAGASMLQTMLRCRPTLLRLIQATRASGGSWSVVRPAARLLGRRGGDIFETGMDFHVGPGWYGLEDADCEKYRWVAQDGQLLVRAGSSHSLAMLVEPGPGLGFQPFVLVVRTPEGDVLGRIAVNGVSYGEVPTPPVPVGSIVPLIFSAERGGPPVGNDPRTLNFRVFAVGQGVRSTAPAPALAEREQWIAWAAETTTPDIDWRSTLNHCRRQIEQMGKPAILHTYACGDFTMMARRHWFDVRGYIEFDGYSMHMDSMLCYAAHHAGAIEEILRPPLRIYHIEHGIGSGWSPEGQDRLFTRLSRKGISWISNDDMAELITHMRTTHSPVIFNPEGWGLVNDQLLEIEPVAQEAGMAAT